MKNLEAELHNEEFDVKIQDCNSGDCFHDCTTSTANNCNAIFSLRY